MSHIYNKICGTKSQEVFLTDHENLKLGIFKAPI
nr:MAG TPA: hypothetical protein [Bacteriophage sp.]